MVADRERSGGRRRFGDEGEQMVAERLERSGYRVLERNVRFRRGELDIVAEKDGVLCFVEVRRRATGAWGDPSATVSGPKQRKVVRAAMGFLARHGLFERMIRFDVASVVGCGRDAVVEYLPAAFDAGC
jgi:putative endonuclease